MKALNLYFNPNLNLNLNLVLVLLPFLPRYMGNRCWYLLSAIGLGKTNRASFQKSAHEIRIRPWLNGGLISSYATTTSGASWLWSAQPRGPSYYQAARRQRKAKALSKVGRGK